VDATIGTIDDAIEESYGAHLCRNRDDDDRNGLADASDSDAVNGENDLLPLHIAIRPQDLTAGDLRLEVTAPDGQVAVWETEQRAVDPLAMIQEWSLAGDAVPSSIFVEGVEASEHLRDVRISLSWELAGASHSDHVAVTVYDVTVKHRMPGGTVLADLPEDAGDGHFAAFAGGIFRFTDRGAEQLELHAAVTPQLDPLVVAEQFRWKVGNSAAFSHDPAATNDIRDQVFHYNPSYQSGTSGDAEITLTCGTVEVEVVRATFFALHPQRHVMTAYSPSFDLLADAATNPALNSHSTIARAFGIHGPDEDVELSPNWVYRRSDGSSARSFSTALMPAGGDFAGALIAYSLNADFYGSDAADPAAGLKIGYPAVSQIGDYHLMPFGTVNGVFQAGAIARSEPSSGFAVSVVTLDSLTVTNAEEDSVTAASRSGEVPELMVVWKPNEPTAVNVEATVTGGNSFAQATPVWTLEDEISGAISNPVPAEDSTPESFTLTFAAPGYYLLSGVAGDTATARIWVNDCIPLTAGTTIDVHGYDITLAAHSRPVAKIDDVCFHEAPQTIELQAAGVFARQIRLPNTTLRWGMKDGDVTEISFAWEAGESPLAQQFGPISARVERFEGSVKEQGGVKGQVEIRIINEEDQELWGIARFDKGVSGRILYNIDGTAQQPFAGSWDLSEIQDLTVKLLKPTANQAEALIGEVSGQIDETGVMRRTIEVHDKHYSTNGFSAEIKTLKLEFAIDFTEPLATCFTVESFNADINVGAASQILSGTIGLKATWINDTMTATTAGAAGASELTAFSRVRLSDINLTADFDEYLDISSITGQGIRASIDGLPAEAQPNLLTISDFIYRIGNLERLRVTGANVTYHQFGLRFDEALYDVNSQAEGIVFSNVEIDFTRSITGYINDMAIERDGRIRVDRARIQSQLPHEDGGATPEQFEELTIDFLGDAHVRLTGDNLARFDGNGDPQSFGKLMGLDGYIKKLDIEFKKSEETGNLVVTGGIVANISVPPAPSDPGAQPADRPSVGPLVITQGDMDVVVCFLETEGWGTDDGQGFDWRISAINTEVVAEWRRTDPDTGEEQLLATARIDQLQAGNSTLEGEGICRGTKVVTGSFDLNEDADGKPKFSCPADKRSYSTERAGSSGRYFRRSHFPGGTG
jgi:hypothetical protein